MKMAKSVNTASDTPGKYIVLLKVVSKFVFVLKIDSVLIVINICKY